MEPRKPQDCQWLTMGLQIVADYVTKQAVHRKVLWMVSTWLHDGNRGRHGRQAAAQGKAVAD